MTTIYSTNYQLQHPKVDFIEEQQLNFTP